MCDCQYYATAIETWGFYTVVTKKENKKERKKNKHSTHLKYLPNWSPSL